MKLTAKSIADVRVPAGRSEIIEFDDDVPGFGIRVRAGGSRTWVFQYKIGEKHRRMTFGAVSALGIKDARDRAERLHAKVKLGEDPAGQKIEARTKASQTFDAVLEVYLDDLKARLRPRSFAEVDRHLRSHAKPLHRLHIDKITRQDIASCLRTVRERSGDVTANRVRTSISAFFSWAMQEGKAEANPVIGTRREEEKPRERVLASVELRAIWNALEDDHHGAIVKLLMLTGQRRDEIGGLRRSELRDDAIELPGARTKNRRDHIVPLSGPARDLLAAQPMRTDGDGAPRDLIFGLGAGGFSGWSRCKERLDERIAEAGHKLAPWTLHDLRRTLSTGMHDDLKILPHVVEAVLNHYSGHRAGVAGTYNKATYLAEKRQALDLWAARVMAVVEGRDSNVVPMVRTV